LGPNNVSGAPISQAHFFRTVAAAGSRTVLLDATDAERPTAMSGREVASAAASLAAVLAERGLERGDRVAVFLPNGRDFALLYLACLHGGITVVPVNPALPDTVVRHILAVTSPRLVVFDNAHRARVPETSAARWPVAAAGDVARVAAGGKSAVPCDDSNVLFSVTFTSGTTSLPKGVCHRAGATLANVDAFNELVGLGPDARMLHVMPMAYMAGFLNTLLSPLAAGGTVVLAPQFDAGSALRFWQPAIVHGASTMWLTPTMCAFLVRANRDPEVPAWTRTNLPYVFVGTAPLPLPVRETFESAFGTMALESYGMTEIMLTTANSATTPVKVGSVGRSIAGVTLQTRGQDGEIWVKSAYALTGYVAIDVPEPRSPLVDGWFPTGDVGHVDTDGNLYITGRIKDLIINGGTNVSPRAVEEVLLTCTGVADAAVVGTPHAFWGEEVVAFVEADAAAWDTLMPALRERCRSELPPAAVPNRFLRRDVFPRSVTGKVQKNLLRDQLDASAGPRR
jgi:long-chain acyl-CoA synthetase